MPRRNNLKPKPIKGLPIRKKTVGRTSVNRPSLIGGSLSKMGTMKGSLSKIKRN